MFRTFSRWMQHSWLYFAIFGFGTGLTLLVQFKYQQDCKAAKAHYQREAHDQTQEVRSDVEHVFKSMYQGLRTIALLPGVRKIDRYAKRFDADARQTKQELYNNLASNVAMSEVYIVPLDMEPDRIDPHTKKLQEPITTFDKLIVGHTADQGGEEKDDEHKAPEIEEIEIYEYRTMKKQLAWLRQRYPQDRDIAGLSYPALCGAEIITCDNSRYSPSHPDDKDRCGLVYSVPFYGTNGKLKGCISGIILTHNLRDLLPTGNYVLTNRTQGYLAASHALGDWQSSQAWIVKGLSDPDRLYSESIRPKIADQQGNWNLWAGQPDARFWNRSDVVNAHHFAWIGYASALLLTLGLTTLTALARSHRRAIETKNLELEARNKQLQALATTDPLTGLPNHRSLVATLDQEIERSQRFDRPCAVLFLDLDHFKAINDVYGHAAGDSVLQELSAAVRTCLRGMDTVGRWGGEEFMAILPETARDNALEAGERIRAAVAARTFSVGGGVHVTCSIGVAIYPEDALSRPDLASAADRAMYAAKHLGRNQVRSADDPALTVLNMEAETSREELALQGTVEALARMVEVRDSYTANHTDNVADLATRIALHIGLTAAEARMVGMVGRLHDVGKVGVPDAVLRKPAALTPEEWQVIKQHSMIGADVVGRVPALRGITASIRGHHEHWDGNGYPDGLKGEDIPLGARIITVADAYSAMTTDRPYRKALDKTWARSELRRCAGSQFDPKMVAALEAVLEQLSLEQSNDHSADRAA